MISMGKEITLIPLQSDRTKVQQIIWLTWWPTDTSKNITQGGKHESYMCNLTPEQLTNL
jgi:hypothetical protein